MKLKDELLKFMQEELHFPLVGIAPPDDFLPEEVHRIVPVQELLARSTPLADGLGSVLHPRDFLPEVQSVIVTGTPCYFGEELNFEECRESLVGRTDPLHVCVEYLHQVQEKKIRMTAFFAERGLQCFSATGGQFPIKLAASKCGVGFYGKNCSIQHPDFGSWISLNAYVTDAMLEPDEPLHGDCGTCDLCIKACPTGAIYAPYRCDPQKCVNFQLAWNKKKIPYQIREKCENLLEENCNECRHACPKNRNLKPVDDLAVPEELAYPSLFKILEMTDEEWDSGFGMTLAGFFLYQKKYLQRNALIALGNFKDPESLGTLEKVLSECEDPELREYAAWAIGHIGGANAARCLESALDKEKNESVKEEIRTCLSSSINFSSN